MAQITLREETLQRLQRIALAENRSVEDVINDLLHLYDEEQAELQRKRLNLNNLIAEALEDDVIEKPTTAREPSDAFYRQKYDDDPDYFA